jgi:hypothetical protein
MRAIRHVLIHRSSLASMIQVLHDLFEEALTASSAHVTNLIAIAEPIGDVNTKLIDRSGR